MTRKRLIFNAVLVAGVIALGLALWLTRSPVPTPPQSVSQLAAGAIQRIELHLPNAVVALERPAASAPWRMRTPVAARTDKAPIQTLMALATAVPSQRYERGEIDDDTTGLDDPALVVRFNDRAPIAIGNEGPKAGSRYVATAHALLLVDAERLNRLPMTWRGWVAPTLLGDHAELEQLTLPRLTLSRSETGGWQVAPSKADRGADYAQATIDAWRHSRALALEPVHAGRQRIARVTLRFADKPARRLDVIEREPALILRDEELGIDYHFAPNLAAPLLDMQHPDTLGAARERSLQPSAIPLRAPDEGRSAEDVGESS